VSRGNCCHRRPWVSVTSAMYASSCLHRCRTSVALEFVSCSRQAQQAVHDTPVQTLQLMPEASMVNPYLAQREQQRRMSSLDRGHSNRKGLCCLPAVLWGFG
jgi:hypothetical protein